MTNYLDQALVFIGSAVVLVPIFNRLGFGSVLGYLIAGILVGPFGLKLIRESESVLHFAELGVVLLLFIIGLEIQPPKLWSMRRNLLGLGGTQVALTSAIFMGIGLMSGLSPLAAGVIGFSLSLSSTAFTVQTLTERNEFRTEFGQASFSILLMQDLIAIPALAIIPALAATGESNASLGSVMIFLPSFLIFGFLASRFLIRPIFRGIASINAKEIFTVATLFVVLGVASLMMKVGLSAALGSFIAGVLLADSEYRHELEANIDPFKSLLMGLFFIAVGMGVSLDLIASKPFFVIGLAIAYVFLKMLVLYTAGRIFRFDHENSRQMAVNLAQGGEFAFVIFGIVTSSKLAPQATVDLLTAVVTLSMAMSPFLVLGLDKWNAMRYKEAVEPKYDSIKDESPEVIIAGFGRFGQMFGRMLRSQSIPFIAIDHDSEQIELIRKFGHKVYYGDASRLDLLEAAGAKKAKYFVLAIDDMEASLKTAKLLRDHFPHLHIFARARNRGHAFELMELGITHVKRETIDSSILFIGDLLVEMGVDKDRAKEMVTRFRKHDELMLHEQFKVRKDDKMFVSVSKQAQAQLMQVLNDETSQSYFEPKTSNAQPTEDIV
ncbi:monovalent cation:proton antiporter-2 (CPA2) family protein [Peredibacter starrii]|uniref:Monovalent cation:proton antiporter-2 (CPA2) family protein n=1 Tax=Peredibacter starrii TaxID=28202 RepID=A0AAX4HLR3_9BACT|nr:monovalent cation:proton antiporter-2 (CPA2) family protein [Peredibacter starrii]WPU64115.1 monovalent cation:proton antiporter-2 (CPA2) family protein [Peredibacter starrii]